VAVKELPAWCASLTAFAAFLAHPDALVLSISVFQDLNFVIVLALALAENKVVFAGVLITKVVCKAVSLGAPITFLSDTIPVSSFGCRVPNITVVWGS
jgi:hypothetical protein